MENAKVFRGTAALIVMHSVDSGPNHQVPIGQPIPNFPHIPDDIYQLSGILSLPVLSLARRIDKCSTQRPNVVTS